MFKKVFADETTDQANLAGILRDSLLPAVERASPAQKLACMHDRFTTNDGRIDRHVPVVRLFSKC